MIHPGPHFQSNFKKCGSEWIVVDQVDPGYHNTPWWTSSVQDHLGPRSDIFLMLLPTVQELSEAKQKLGKVKNYQQKGESSITQSRGAQKIK